jgi:hypothetical protein
VPQDFLDKAVYPVIVDPTFGYSGVSATNNTFTANNVYAINPTVLATGGTLSKVTVYASGAATTVAKMGVYADNGSNYPGVAVAVDNTGVNLPTSITWKDSGALSGTLINGNKYWLAMVSITNNDTVRTETITGEQAYYKAGTELADPYPASASNGGTIRAAFYATYTAEANTVSVSPTANEDDGYISSSGNAFTNTGLAVNLGEYNQRFDSFVRFPNVIVPKNAVILSAYVVYIARYDGANTDCITKMYFNDVDNATAPTTWSQYHNLASTTAEVPWTITPVLAGGFYTSPDIKSLVQEIVDRPGWSSGNAMMLLHEDNESTATYAIRYMTSFDDTTYAAPILRITYSENRTPTINSVADTPDPIGVGANLKFDVNWSDEDSGEMAKVVVCKTYEMTTTTLTCGGGAWAASDKFTNRNPESVSYTTVADDKGNTRNYYVYVCDDSGLSTACSTPTAGTFTAANQIPDAPISLLVDGMEIGNAINLTDTTPEFSAVYKDFNDEGDAANKMCVLVQARPDSFMTNLSGYWRINEGVGTSVPDRSGNGADGTLAFSDHWDSEGYFDGGYYFDGVDDYVNITDNTAGAFGTGDFSVSFWMKHTTTPDSTWYDTVITTGNGGSAPKWEENWAVIKLGTLQTEASWNKISFIIGKGTGAGYFSFNSTSQLTDDKWHLVTVTADRDDYAKIYIDGAYETQLAISGTVADLTSTQGIHIGRNNASGFDLTGRLAEVAIWKRVLTATEVAALYKMWDEDSAWCYSGSAISATSENARSPEQSYNGTVPTLDGTRYYWRSWFWDDDGERSATSTTGWFRLGNSASGDGVRLKGGRLNGGVRLK